jgi:hypothetical protein
MLPKKFIRLLLIVLATALIGCSPTLTEDDDISAALAQSPPPQPLPDITATVLTAVAQVTMPIVPTNAPDPTVTATALPIITVTPIATATFLPTPTVTATPYPTNFSAFCEKRELERVNYHATGISGFLPYVVLDDAVWQAEGAQTGLVGSDPLQARPFPPESNIEVIGFSPSGNWFAYIKEAAGQPWRSEPFVYLLSVAGETVKTLMPPETAEGKPYLGLTWISDELLMIQYISVPESSLGSYMVDSYSIFNAFTGEARNHLLDSLPDWDEWRTPYFSPDMTRVVYFTQSHNQIGTSIALWDIDEQAILWVKPFGSTIGIEEKTIGFNGFSQAAFWSPDSQAFVFTTGGQAANHAYQYASYLVDRNGLEERLLLSGSDLADVMALGGYWSPDSRFIYSTYQDTLVYDLATNQVVALCPDYSSNRVAWSPDSRFLAYDEKVGGEHHLLLFNVSNGEVTSLGKITRITSLLQWLENEAWLHTP